MWKNGGINILRVISGSAKGHKLKTPKGDTTRPTSDRVKESLFNIIAHYIPEAEVLDLFAGTGSLGIEALSRGAKKATFADRRQECYQIIKDNLSNTRLADRAVVFTGEAVNILKKLSDDSEKYDIIFLDPPYNKNLIQEALNFISNNDIIRKNGVIVAERDVDDVLPEEVGLLKLVRNQKYGDTILSFYVVSTVQKNLD